MHTTLRESLAIIEDMLADLQEQHRDELSDYVDLGLSVQMAHRHLFNARLNPHNRIESNEAVAAPVICAPLTHMDKWILRNLSNKPKGMPTSMLRAEHDRLVSEQLVEIEGEHCKITSKGIEVIAMMVISPRPRNMTRRKAG